MGRTRTRYVSQVLENMKAGKKSKRKVCGKKDKFEDFPSIYL
jgi:hypothetical protein